MDAFIVDQGEAAVLDVGVHGIHPELVKLLGKMHYRTSYGQNVLKHSIEVAHIVSCRTCSPICCSSRLLPTTC